ncbi:conserved membrane hypothetical protein [Nitrosomonas mobilis]|uniref:DUF4400 domain-containing protein n=2 Tax=Nitrosomonas mobilis TaxID=51642 RepID=A0A1G5SCZ7_9PROT|nr:conserved membrane hypothetical protein [Nitrosomonas mobilis]
MARTDRPNPWSTLIVTLCIIGMIAAWLLIPRQIVEQARVAEQQQMISWAGEGADQWIYGKSSAMALEFSREVVKATSIEMTRELKGWVVDRIYTTILWSDIIFYRMYSLALWFLIAFPVLMAASTDGVLMREIRKNMFISQSPLRLSIGANLFLLSSVLLLLWLFIPFLLPAISAPGMILMMGFSLWMWMANIQKRI